MAEQNSDLVLLARALTYLAVVYRKRGDVARVPEFADDGMRVAAEAQLPQFTGTAHAEYAWLAWHEGDMAETIHRAQAAIDDWGALGTAQTVMPFRWLALVPLLGVALQQEDVEKALTWGQHLLRPPQQRLPVELTRLLENAVSAWDQHLSQQAHELLWQAFQLAQKMHYI